jgi:hypothetical protein
MKREQRDELRKRVRAIAALSSKTAHKNETPKKTCKKKAQPLLLVSLRYGLVL